MDAVDTYIPKSLIEEDKPFLMPIEDKAIPFLAVVLLLPVAERRC